MIFQSQEIGVPKFCLNFLGLVFPEVVQDQIGGFGGV
jgi:hypothetical protein